MNRRDMLKLSSYAVAAASAPALAESASAATSKNGNPSIARWDDIELNLPGPTTGNPFLDVTLTATFRFQHRFVSVDGFYDGEGSYKVRFMPDEAGAWTWSTASNIPALKQVLAARGGRLGYNVKVILETG